MNDPTWAAEIDAVRRRRWTERAVGVLVLGVVVWLGMTRIEAAALAHAGELADSATAWGARADTWDAERRRLQGEYDALSATYSADSARWAARADSAQRRIDEATTRASRVATDLTARLDSVGRALFAEYRAERDSIDAARLTIIVDLRARTASLETRVASLVRVNRTTLDVLDARAEQITALEDYGAAMRRAYAAAARRRWLERGGVLLLVVGVLALR